MPSLTTVDAVVGYLGMADADAPLAQIAARLPAADAQIAAYCGRAFLSGPLIDEVYEPDGPRLYLRQRPVATVESIVGHRSYPATTTPLVAGTHYELRDASRGLVTLLGSGWGDWGDRGGWYGGHGAQLPAGPRQPWSLPYSYLTVSYTPVSTVPADVSLAATLLVAAWVQPTLHPERQGLKSLSIGPGELAISMTDTTATGGMPPEVVALLAPYRSALVFA